MPLSDQQQTLLGFVSIKIYNTDSGISKDFDVEVDQEFLSNPITDFIITGALKHEPLRCLLSTSGFKSLETTISSGKEAGKNSKEPFGTFILY